MPESKRKVKILDTKYDLKVYKDLFEKSENEETKKVEGITRFEDKTEDEI